VSPAAAADAQNPTADGDQYDEKRRQRKNGGICDGRGEPKDFVFAERAPEYLDKLEAHALADDFFVKREGAIFGNVTAKKKQSAVKINARNKAALIPDVAAVRSIE